MKKSSILLACGTGASSGFMANNIRKAIKARGLNMSVKAVSGTSIEDYVDDIDIVMIGPHMANILDDVKEICEPYNVTAAVMNSDYYGSLDGEKALDHILELLKA